MSLFDNFYYLISLTRNNQESTEKTIYLVFTARQHLWQLLGPTLMARVELPTAIPQLRSQRAAPTQRRQHPGRRMEFLRRNATPTPLSWHDRLPKKKTARYCPRNREPTATTREFDAVGDRECRETTVYHDELQRQAQQKTSSQVNFNSIWPTNKMA